MISNHNSRRVLFDKIASVYFILKIYLYLVLKTASPGVEPALCHMNRHTFVPYDLQVGLSTFTDKPARRSLKAYQPLHTTFLQSTRRP